MCLGPDVCRARANEADEIRAACLDRAKGLHHHGCGGYFRPAGANNDA